MSNKKMDKNPLNRSFVKGLIPSACFAFARKPISKLPKISRTLPLVMACLKINFLSISFFHHLLKKVIRINPKIIDGDSMIAKIATM